LKPSHYELSVRSAIEMSGVDLEALWAAIRTKIKSPPIIRRRELIAYEPIAHTLAFGDPDKLPGRIDPEISVEEQMAMYNFWSCGKKVFNVSRNLTNLLLHTDLKFQKRYLKLPYPCFMLRFEDAPIALECSDDTRIQLDGCYVTRTVDAFDSASVQAPEVRRMLAATLRTGTVPDSCHYQETEFLRLYFFSRYIDGIGNGVSTYFTLSDIPDDAVVTDGFIERHNAVRHSDRMNDYSALQRLALNCVLYILSIGSDLTPVIAKGNRLAERAAKQSNPSQRDRLSEEAKQHTRLDFIDVGRRVKMPRTTDAPVQERSGRVWTLSYRSWTMGHWRGTWKKTDNLVEADRPFVLAEKDGKSLFRQWIEPYERGKELAEVINKQYRVDNEAV